MADLQNTIVQTRFSTPRMMAGDDIRTLTNKCHLKEPDPADYPVNPLSGILNSEDFAAKVAEIFPEGVCDFSREPVGFTETIPWLHYGNEEQVIYGGEPLSDDLTPASRLGWASPAFEVSM